MYTVPRRQGNKNEIEYDESAWTASIIPTSNGKPTNQWHDF
jgi:hypothetical protein